MDKGRQHGHELPAILFDPKSLCVLLFIFDRAALPYSRVKLIMPPHNLDLLTSLLPLFHSSLFARCFQYWIVYVDKADIEKLEREYNVFDQNDPAQGEACWEWFQARHSAERERIDARFLSLLYHVALPR